MNAQSEVERLYVEEHLSTRQIAQLLGVGHTKIVRTLESVPKRTKSEAARLRFRYEPFQLHGSPEYLAYLIGVYLGDGHLAQCERTELLDIACDIKYQKMLNRIANLVTQVFGKSPSVIIDKNSNCAHVRLYGTGISSILGFKPLPKKQQNLRIPDWIKLEKSTSQQCLRGLFETDGYLHYRIEREKSIVVGFSNINSTLLDEVQKLLYTLGHQSQVKHFEVMSSGKFGHC